MVNKCNVDPRKQCSKKEKGINMQEKFDQFIEKHWRLVIIGVAVFYIGMGLYQIITKIEIDPTKLRGVEGFLMVIAIGALFYGKKKERERKEEEEALAEQAKLAEKVNVDDISNKTE